MKTSAISLIFSALLGALMSTHATQVFIPNGTFTDPGGSGFGNFASAGTIITFETAGGNPGGFGKVDNTAGTWGGGLVAPADTPAPNLGLPLSSLGLEAGKIYTFSMDMKNFAGTGTGGLKLESWSNTGPISDSGDMPASGSSGIWATYTWQYKIAAGATSIKVVPLVTGNSGASNADSIGFDNIKVDNTPVPPPPFVPAQIPNGDFENNPPSTNWAFIAPETTPTFFTSGGNPGKYVRLSDVSNVFPELYAFNGANVTFAALGLSPGDTYSVIMDMRLNAGGTSDPNTPIGGLRLVGPAGFQEQHWAKPVIGNGTTWQTYTLSLTVPPASQATEVRFGLRPGNTLSGNTVDFDNVFIVLPSAPGPLQASIVKGAAVNWTTSNVNNIFQPQESPDGTTWANLGGSFTGNSVTSVFDETLSSFYRVLESVPSSQDIVYNGNFSEDTGFSDEAEGWNGVQSQPAKRLAAGGRNDNGACMEIKVTNVGSEANGSEFQQNTTQIEAPLQPVNGDVVPGKTYNFSFWANGVNAGAGGYVQQYKVSFLSATGAITGDGGVRAFSSPVGVWTQITQTGLVAPANSASALIQVLGVTGANPGGLGGVLIDDVSLITTGSGTPTVLTPAPTVRSAVKVSWPSKVGKNYQVESSLELNSWSNFGSVTPGNGAVKSVVDVIGVPKKFYRVGELP